MRPETSRSPKLDQFVPMQSKHYLIALLKIFFLILHFMDIFELLGPNDCPQGCVSVLCDYTVKT